MASPSFSRTVAQVIKRTGMARRPWTRRLRLDAALPSGVRGPVDFWAFRRLASICAAVGMRGSFDFFVFDLSIWVVRARLARFHFDITGGAGRIRLAFCASG